MIDFYFDFISPFGYFASLRVEALAERHGLQVRWHPILIGVTVMKLMGLPPILDIPLKGNYLKREVQRYQMLFDAPTKRSPVAPPISALAASRAMALLVRAQHRAAAPFAHACYKAYWQDESDLGDKNCVRDILASLRPAVDDLETYLGEPAKQALHQEMDDAVGRGVFGSPFFIIDDEPFFGVDKFELMDIWLARTRSRMT